MVNVVTVPALKYFPFGRMVAAAADALERFGPLCHEPVEGRRVVLGVIDDDFAVAIERNAIVRVWQILAGEPPVQGVPGHEVDVERRIHCFGALQFRLAHLAEHRRSGRTYDELVGRTEQSLQERDRRQ